VSIKPLKKKKKSQKYYTA